MQAQDTPVKSPPTPPLQSVNAFCRSVGITPVTLWRFRRRRWIETLNIAGRQYVSAEAVARFKERAASGEFSRKHVVPKKETLDNA